MTTVHVILGIVGISVLIFVHELGHFLAAKWAGVCVKTFSLGFDPVVAGFRLRFFAFTWGETQYVVGMIPFGGYVRFLDDTPEGQQGHPGEFARQPARRRAVIFAAGATMNLLFGIGAFILAFAFGVSFQAPEIGTVLPGSAAWDAGLAPGDTIVAVDDTPIESMPDVALAAVVDGCVEHTLTIERAGLRRDVKIAPRIDPTLGMPAFGLMPTAARTVASVSPGSAAAAAGIAPDDEIQAAELRTPAYTARIDAGTLPRGPFIQALRTLAQHHPGEKLCLRVKPPGGAARDVVLAPQPDKDNAVPLLGVKLAQNTVRFVRPGSKAADFFRPGDAVAAVEGAPFMLMTPIDLLRAAGARDTLAITFEDGRGATVARDTLLGWMWREDLRFGAAATRILAVEAGSRAARADLLPGDRIVGVGDDAVGHSETVERLLEARGEAETALQVVRQGGARRIVLPPGGALGIAWDERPEIGGAEPDSPAAAEGLRSGDRVLRVGNKAIASWDEFVEAVHSARDTELTVIVQRGADEITVAARPVERAFGTLGIGFNELRVLIKEPNAMRAMTLGVKRTVISIKQVFVFLLRLAKREVAARNLQGPLGIIHVTGYVTRYGAGTLLYFLALISVNLGVLNLLPIPIFDGGHLMLLACEKIKGSPVNERLVNTVTTVMFFLLIALAIYVTFHDVIRLVG
ncbi:MAG TPA: RIP metalloprotease RseP [Planctomycetota bacterium]|jgi:regulator of sigma E protease|nr:RIP metalloprotease RseP [Planctomycetota bacterium]OQC20119.1 MAG: Regulator of sigma-E protease RseP [Planctomycetes bacterium ADurb.Bin069]HNU26912.1 RIP metalloprotease RseP [Planctomycetota bacterium]HOE30725.1 RIP metalloprotease RseP [Planctomycetota bacterium]HOE87903.1 RIP metalloprotease RseP [Planctomycetota bacterium]